MSEVPGKKVGEQGEPEPRVTFADMAPLIKRAREFLEVHRKESVSFTAPGDLSAFARDIGFAPKKKGRPEVILADDVGVELGHPSTASRSIVLVTFQQELVRHGQITLVGPDFGEMRTGERRAFTQVVMLALGQEAALDPFEVESAQYLTHRLPGYMVRSVPGRLWVRISKDALARGLTARGVGSALVAAYRGDFEGIEGVEIMLVTSAESAVEELAPIATEATILAGRHKKLFLGVDGEVECTELNCETCDERPVCDNLRDIVIKRRSRRND